MNDRHSFEVTDYSDPEMSFADAYQVIRQIMVDMTHDVPSVSVYADMSGNQLKLHYMDYVQNLPVHLKETVARGDLALRELVKHLKAEFKKRAGRALKLKECKDLENYTVEKVSINERYYYRCWRVFEVSF